MPISRPTSKKALENESGMWSLKCRDCGHINIYDYDVKDPRIKCLHCGSRNLKNLDKSFRGRVENALDVMAGIPGHRDYKKAKRAARKEAKVQKKKFESLEE